MTSEKVHQAVKISRAISKKILKNPKIILDNVDRI